MSAVIGYCFCIVYGVATIYANKDYIYIFIGYKVQNNELYNVFIRCKTLLIYQKKWYILYFITLLSNNLVQGC